MNDDQVKKAFEDVEMVNILERLLEDDETISARAVARLHPSIKAASSITRHPARSKLLDQYQDKQNQYRRWSKKSPKYSRASIAYTLTDKDIRIAELQKQVDLLIASHVAMIRVVGELGGFSKWVQFYANYRDIRATLEKIGAMHGPNVKQFDSEI